MKTKTTDTPRTDAALADAELIGYDCPIEFCRQLEREVARLRELLNRAIEISEEYRHHARKNINEDCDWSMHDTHKKFNAFQAEARLALAPEEPVIQDSRITEPSPDWREPTAEESKVLEKVLEELREEDKHFAPEWRELGPDEVIQEGDQVQPKHHDRKGAWIWIWSHEIGATPRDQEAMRYRTRRPLPKQEEMPLEKELDYLTCEASRASDIHNHVLIVDCLRYLRDEIQKLKTQTHYHHESYCRKCKEPK